LISISMLMVSTVIDSITAYRGAFPVIDSRPALARLWRAATIGLLILLAGFIASLLAGLFSGLIISWRYG